jgi:hypothetical protein
MGRQISHARPSASDGTRSSSTRPQIGHAWGQFRLSRPPQVTYDHAPVGDDRGHAPLAVGEFYAHLEPVLVVHPQRQARLRHAMGEAREHGCAKGQAWRF